MKIAKRLIFTISLGLLVTATLSACSNSELIPSSNETEQIEDENTQSREIYKLAVQAGYEGSYEEWLESIKGENGLSAYDIYIKYHPEYKGSEEDWIKDLASGRLEENLHSVTFNYNDTNTKNLVTKVYHGYNVDMPKTPIRENYVFDGWYLDDYKWNFDIYTVARDIELKARWIPATYTITLDFNDTNIENQKISGEYNQDINLSHIEIPHRAGYEFSHWIDSAGKRVGNIYPIAGNEVLTAVWNKVPYIGELIYDAINPVTTYKWDRNHNGVLECAILIGQYSHNDSFNRTYYAEKALTRIGRELNISVSELSKEMVSESGNYWDSIVAAETMRSWLNEYGDSIDCVISNNDIMASASYNQPGWIKGLPVFGFDTLPSTAKDIHDGKLTGSITQNGDAQARIIAQLLRNLAENDADPLNNGITKEDAKGNKVQRCKVEYNEAERKLLVTSGAVTKKNADDYLAGSFESITDNKGTRKLNVLVSIYNQDDSLLKEAYKPAFDAYGKALGIKFTYIEGNGADEGSCLDKFVNLDQYDAYVINVVKTESGSLYTNKLTGKNAEKPLIFYNRQLFTYDGEDSATMSFNDNTYYVGVDETIVTRPLEEMIYNWFMTNK